MTCNLRFVMDCQAVAVVELRHDKTNKMSVPSEDSDQPGHPLRVFPVSMKKAWVLSYPLSAQWRLWSDWVDAQADLNLHWVHTYFVGFVMSRLSYLAVQFNLNLLQWNRLVIKTASSSWHRKRKNMLFPVLWIFDKAVAIIRWHTDW